MISCAAAAVAAVLAQPREAKAQAFQGDPTTAMGTVTYSRDSSPIVGSETITVGSPTATINWAPYDTQGTGNIDFLPDGYVATFINDPQLTSDYTVLNRIVPTDPNRAIELNGSVLGRITDGINTSTGGNIWFYSPGGIVVGANAVFDVGSLLLSTIDIANGWWVDGDSFSATFLQTEETTPGAIQILGGGEGSISAPGEGSYIALIAPRIEQGGNVQVNGSAAYVAAEQLTMTMNQGLFDIQIDLGTGDENGIVHSGTTGGAASTGEGDNHRIYMVAVPKNEALTMLLSGTIGFDEAVTAGVENGEIILGSGRWFDGSAHWASPYNSSMTIGGAQGAATFTSDVLAQTTHHFNVLATTASVDFQGDLIVSNALSFSSDNTTTLSAHSGHAISVGGNLWLYSTNSETESKVLIEAYGGGDVSVDGDAVLFVQNGDDGSLGQIEITAQDEGSTINFSGNMAAYANDYAGYEGTGGQILVQAREDGSITAGSMNLQANAQGGASEGIGGSAEGGLIQVIAEGGGNIDVTGAVSASANAVGGNGMYGGNGGGAQGGDIEIYAYNDGVINTGGLQLSADGTGQDGYGRGGNGEGGYISVEAYSGGSITVNGDIVASADGIGGAVIGDGSEGYSSDGYTSVQFGGFGQGGQVYLTVNDGTLDVTGAVDMSAGATGGAVTSDASSGSRGRRLRWLG
jgi:filamentous hemagglutinin family protein